ncbi:MAG: hypothetical protein WBB65_00475 [Anaerolineales bacterium]
MNATENKGLIDRYVAAVGQRLPSKIRADVERELRSSLLDAVEDQARELGGSADEALVKTILRGMDHPEKMAARYSASQYLVGPRLYPAFLKVTRIVLIVMAALFVFGLLAGSYKSGQGISLATIGASLASLYMSIFASIGFLLAVFAILERYVLNGHKPEEKDWDPDKLPQVKDLDIVSPVSAVMGIFSAVAGIALINFFPEWVGVSYFRAGAWHHISALTPAFMPYVLPTNLILGALILLNLVLLRRGTWEPLTRWVKAIIWVAGIVLLGAMLVGPPVGYVSTQGMAPLGGQEFSLDYLLVLIMISYGVQLLKFVIKNRIYFQIPLSK